MIRVEIPAPLRTLARITGEVELEIAAPPTQRAVVEALEERYPMLRGAVRDLASGQRRSYLRFFACQEDLSYEGLDARLPDRVVRGEEPFLIIGAVAGG